VSERPESRRDLFRSTFSSKCGKIAISFNLDLKHVLIYTDCHRKIDQREPIPDRVAIVAYKGKRAGLLSEVGPDTRFVYDDGWVQSIACALPAQTREHFWRGGLIPFFEHLGPEGWLRGRQARAGGTPDQDDFGLLLNYGADCIGAVGIVPLDGTHTHKLEHADLLDDAATKPGRTLSGVQKKWLVYRAEDGFRPSIQLADPATHIAKFNRADLPTLVQNENLSLRLAREVLGQDAVTAAHLGSVRGAEGLALLVERFDRVAGARLRLEDFCQILEKPRGREFDGKYNSSYEEAASAIERFSARARIDLDRYYRLVVFNLVIGNADAHLKNFSLLERPEGLRLSPAYDLVNTLIYQQYDNFTALAIGGEKREFEAVSRPLVTKLGTDIGLPARAVESALDQLAKRFAAAASLQLPARIEADDFRYRYREAVWSHAQRILE
jgi:serine/threonine-protein kinase HipA